MLHWLCLLLQSYEAARWSNLRCLGLSRRKTGDVRQDDAQVLPAGARDFQFACLGFTMHTTDNAGDVLPYCEGIELLSYEEPEQVQGDVASCSAHSQPTRTEQVSTSAACSQMQQQPDSAGLSTYAHDRSRDPSPSGNAGPSGDRGNSGNGRPKGFYERLWAQADQNLSAMSAMLQNKGPIRLASFDSIEALQQRFSNVNADNSRRMEAAVTVAGICLSSMCTAMWNNVSSLGSAAGDRGRRQR